MSEPVTQRLPTGSDGAPVIAIRPVRAEDVDAVAVIERASFSDPWSRSAFERLVGDHRVHFMVACAPPPAVVAAAPSANADRVVGYVVAWFVMDEGEIANLATAPEARGQGVGARLLDATIQAARARRISSVYLEVRDSNGVARRLYASRGFTEVARRKRYYRRPVEDALVLRLVLPVAEP